MALHPPTYDLKTLVDSPPLLAAVLRLCVADLKAELAAGPPLQPVLIGTWARGGAPEQGALRLPEVLEAAATDDDVPLWKRQWLFFTMLFVSEPLRERVCASSPKAVRDFYMADFGARFSTAVAGRIVRHDRGSEVVVNASDPLYFTVTEYLRVFQTYSMPT